MHFNAADMQNVTLVLLCTTSRLKDRWSVRRRGFGVYQLCSEMQVHEVLDFVSPSNDISPSMILFNGLLGRRVSDWTCWGIVSPKRMVAHCKPQNCRWAVIRLTCRMVLWFECVRVG